VSDATEVVERYYAALGARDSGAAAELLASDCRVSVPGATLDGAAAWRDWAQSFIDAFPDITHEHGDLDEDGERVSTSVHIRGTQSGQLVSPRGTLPPTGREVDFVAENELAVTDGRITALDIAFDQLDLMRQLGVAG
jgi:predicted ester cyclase